MRHAIKSALSLLFIAALAATPAIAKDHGRGHDRGGDRYDRHDRDDRDDDRYEDRRRGDKRYHDDRYYRSAPARVVYRPVYRNEYRPVYRPVYRSGYSQPRWARGVRYYDNGYAPTYVIQDYRGYGLRAPPRGYHWRRSDAGDYLLVAVATGIIADLILRN